MDSEQPPSIALVVLDTLRKDYFDKFFDWLPGIRFENAYSTSQWTIPAHASIFTGQYPLEVGVHSKHLYFDCPEPALAETLADHEYTTRGFSANPNLSGHFGFDRGFDTFESPLDLMHLNSDRIIDWKSFVDESSHSGLSMYAHGVLKCIFGDCNTVMSFRSGLQQVLSDNTYTNPGGSEEVQNWLTRQTFDDPSFLFLNLMEAHEPYWAPDEYMSVETPNLTHSIGDLVFEDEPNQTKTNPERIVTAYECCARYLSDQYRDLFEQLSAMFDYVITVADHGELLGEHDAWNHEHGIYPELTHVPLVVSGEGLKGKRDDVVSLVDIHTTVLRLAGIDNNQATQGQNLFDTNSERDILTQYTGLTPWSEDRLRESDTSDDILEKYDEELYGIATPDGSYAYQTVDKADVIGEGIDEPEERIQRLVNDLTVRNVESQDDAIPDDVRQQLEDLGYA
ncbi:sulfatase [Halocalculus aciditolerans]|uniref:Sulfatase N-terminal domain-containing protein n=1 Tax=Halocalculus aciditolerans TaxID=1383812 RepID=A0A830FPB9_9EURY|nr:sulfatase [Halocalculus aciditolerans]GGL73047.1 hypothetical protein GCM10009039_33860 [Halocalculus aciditolerans]